MLGDLLRQRRRPVSLRRPSCWTRASALLHRAGRTNHGHGLVRRRRVSAADAGSRPVHRSQCPSDRRRRTTSWSRLASARQGGPSGGGYGLVVADQGPDPHDGVNQGGRFVALEAGDQGLIGAWQREEDRWIDLQPWTPSAAVHEGSAVNELMVRVQGQQLTFLVNGTQVAQVTTKLAAGRVGVFVGGDGNQVALERFTVQSAGSASPISSRSPATATPRATATARPPPTPIATPTPVVDALLGQLDAAWAQGDWPKALSLLDRIEQLAPSALDFQDKRYAAHVAAGQDLLAKGSTTAAVGELTKAEGIDPDRSEARAALVALTPTPRQDLRCRPQTSRCLNSQPRSWTTSTVSGRGTSVRGESTTRPHPATGTTHASRLRAAQPFPVTGRSIALATQGCTSIRISSRRSDRPPATSQWPTSSLTRSRTTRRTWSALQRSMPTSCWARATAWRSNSRLTVWRAYGANQLPIAAWPQLRT